MGRYFVPFLIASCLIFGQVVTMYASYRGWGVTPVRQNPSARTGSLGGPTVLGGGPSDGK